MEKAMLEAGKEVKRLEEQKGDYHQGILANTVIVDGGWSKHSDKHSCNAKSEWELLLAKKLVRFYT